MLRKLTSLSITTNSLPFFRVSTKSKMESEKTVVIDLQNIEAFYEEKEFSSVAFINFAFSLADLCIKDFAWIPQSEITGITTVMPTVFLDRS